jgi:hypothetical protein
MCNVVLTLNGVFAYPAIIGTFYAPFMAVFIPKLLAASGLLVTRRTASVQYVVCLFSDGPEHPRRI